MRRVSERIFEVFNITLMLLLMAVIVYPLLYVLFASFSNPVQFSTYNGLLLKPIGFNVTSYIAVFQNPMIVTGYINSILYVVVGTFLNLFLTITGAYVLSRKGVYWNKLLLFMVVFTMFFNGGLIPTFLLVQALGLKNTMWSIILPTAISVWNLIIMRTSFSGIPDSLEESAKIDGANDFYILWKIIIPISKAIIAVILLFYGVANWNRWFEASIYLTERSKYPLQLILREILIANNTDNMMSGVMDDRDKVSITIQYATIMVATIPVMCIYPFLQKYFVQGVMVGAIKG